MNPTPAPRWRVHYKSRAGIEQTLIEIGDSMVTALKAAQMRLATLHKTTDDGPYRVVFIAPFPA